MKMQEEAYEKFLDQWPNPDEEHFIRDGAFDWDRYQSAHPRVLFLLKEAYASDGKFNDVRNLVRKRNKPKDQTWWRLADWAYLAQQGMHESASLGKATKPQRFEALKSTALINIKKTGGVKQSDNQEIKAIALQHGDLLVQQIEMLDPHIVICGNTWKAMQAVFREQKIDCEQSPYDFVRNVRERYFIKMVHPAIRGTKLISYSIPFLLQQAGVWNAIGEKPADA